MTDLKPEMLFIDLETTGLRASREVPLELGMVLTDRWGNQIDGISWVVYEYDRPGYRDAWHGMIEYVRNMHKTSGLWDDIVQRRIGSTRDFVQTEARRWLQEHGIKSGVMPITGNSIGSLDRPFLIQHFPELNSFFHHRNIDISSFKEVCRLTNPELFEQIKDIVENKEAATHRSLDDCYACIREYQTYLDEFLITENL